MLNNEASLPQKPAWWECLIFQRPINSFTFCSNCGASNDSIDVVCTVDSTVLIGINSTDKTKTIIINFFRSLAVGVALAVGYLNWLWPTYIFVGFLLVTFYSFFLRNHSQKWYFFLLINIASYLGVGLWHLFRPEAPSLSWIVGLTFIVLIVNLLLFLTAFTLRTTEFDSRHEWLSAHGVDIQYGTIMWISFMLTATVLLLLGLIVYQVAPTNFSGQFINIDLDSASKLFLPGMLFFRGALMTLGMGEITALVVSTVYSLRSKPFHVSDKWVYRPVVSYKNFKRLPNVTFKTAMNWATRFNFTLQRAINASSNRLIDGIENGYNNFYVRFINNLARTVITIANAVRRTIIKTVLHTTRSLRRFFTINKWCLKWSWHVLIQYFRIFVAPIMLFIFAAILTISFGESFFSYVNGGVWYLPLTMLVKGIGLVILFSIGTGLLSRLNLFSFFDKVLNALSIFGTSAFLFFVLSAWLLGLTGMLTDGPYRIGWVTIISTLALLIIFLIAQKRTSTESSSL